MAKNSNGVNLGFEGAGLACDGVALADHQDAGEALEIVDFPGEADIFVAVGGAAFGEDLFLGHAQLDQFPADDFGFGG